MSKKKRISQDGLVFSTGSSPIGGDDDSTPGAPGEHPKGVALYVSIDKKSRKGKAVTLVEGFEGNEEALKQLGKVLKNKCGVGGTTKDGEIIIQGEVRDRVIQLLEADGYTTKRKGG